MPHISSHFDSGNIVVNEVSANTARLSIRTDNASEHMQWFHFRVTTARGEKMTYILDNANKASYPDAWENYRVRVSHDREHWTCVDTAFNGTELTWKHTAEHDIVWFAYFAPYSEERHLDGLALAQQHPGVRIDCLTQTLDGADLDRIVVGNPNGPKVWAIARQHPGETMAEWCAEGLVDRLLDDADPVARWLLANTQWHIVPNCNPDGSRRGNLRTNAAGANLNREWVNPTAERCPEVKAILAAMDESGVDMCLDIHGDEAIPQTFVAGAEGVPRWNDAMQAQLEVFQKALVHASPDFQTAHGYPKDAAGEANLTMATNQVAERFGAFSVTLEMPFKDHDDLPDAEVAFSPERAKRLGGALLDAIRALVTS